LPCGELCFFAAVLRLSSSGGAGTSTVADPPLAAAPDKPLPADKALRGEVAFAFDAAALAGADCVCPWLRSRAAAWAEAAAAFDAPFIAAGELAVAREDTVGAAGDAIPGMLVGREGPVLVCGAFCDAACGAVCVGVVVRGACCGVLCVKTWAPALPCMARAKLAAMMLIQVWCVRIIIVPLCIGNAVARRLRPARKWPA
jgi:hypothetical protein